MGLPLLSGFTDNRENIVLFKASLGTHHFTLRNLGRCYDQLLANRKRIAYAYLLACDAACSTITISPHGNCHTGLALLQVKLVQAGGN
jgi:hypothetical protein